MFTSLAFVFGRTVWTTLVKGARIKAWVQNSRVSKLRLRWVVPSWALFTSHYCFQSEISLNGCLFVFFVEPVCWILWDYEEQIQPAAAPIKKLKNQESAHSLDHRWSLHIYFSSYVTMHVVPILSRLCNTFLLLYLLCRCWKGQWQRSESTHHSEEGAGVPVHRCQTGELCGNKTLPEEWHLNTLLWSVWCFSYFLVNLLGITPCKKWLCTTQIRKAMWIKKKPVLSFFLLNLINYLLDSPFMITWCMLYACYHQC